MLEEKDIYDIHDLFDNLDISIRKLADVAQLSEVTLARIRDGKPTYRRTANHLLKVFSGIYERPFYLNKVTGINVAISGRKRMKEERLEEVA